MRTRQAVLQQRLGRPLDRQLHRRGQGSYGVQPLHDHQPQHHLRTVDTAPEPAPEIVAMYGDRWNIETDLRSLKRTVRLHHIAIESVAMLEKELLMAVCAYNLVRAVMCLAARKGRVDPRQFSFAGVPNVVDCAWPKLAAATTQLELQREIARVLKLAAQCTLPKRTRRRSYPRVIWRRQPGFPYRKGEN
jgi:putative transposase